MGCIEVTSEVQYRFVKNVWQKIFEEIEVNSVLCSEVWWLQVMFRRVKNVWQKIFGNIEVNSEICSDV